MTAVKINAEIDQDGNFRLEVPIGLAPGKAEVMVQPQEVNGHREAQKARSGLFIGTSPNLDVDAALDEMNHAWKSMLSGSP